MIKFTLAFRFARSHRRLSASVSFTFFRGHIQRQFFPRRAMIYGKPGSSPASEYLRVIGINWMRALQWRLTSIVSPDWFVGHFLDLTRGRRQGDAVIAMPRTAVASITLGRSEERLALSHHHDVYADRYWRRGRCLAATAGLGHASRPGHVALQAPSRRSESAIHGTADGGS